MSAKKSTTSVRAKPAASADALLARHAGALSLLARETAAPSPAVKARLLSRVRASLRPQPDLRAASAVPPGWRFETVGAEAGWFALPFPGVRMKQLSVDGARDVMQMLVEIAPGARFPDHEHVLAEEGLVLSGDVQSGGRLLRAGDYYHAGAGTRHTDVVSPGGCVALLSFSVTGWNRWRAALAATRK